MPVPRDIRSRNSFACLLERLESRQLLSAAVPNIMPMGDSITEAFTGHASYRYWLWNSLADAGYTANFVGFGSGVADGPPLYPGFDTDHEGHSGWRADELEAGLRNSTWKSFAKLPQNKPDIVLLHIGSNDMEQGQSSTSTRDEIGKIIDDLRAVNPNVTVLLAKLIPETGLSMSTLNSLLPALVSSKNTTQSRVILVDQSTGFTAAADTYDGMHPNEAGEKKMAAKWLAALTPLLPAPTPEPEGTYLDTPAVALTKATNPIGPVEYEMSNGSDTGGDGQMLSIRGQKFMRGFGVHANSELDFALPAGAYGRFRATVGVDDEVDGLGSVVFQVFVNNEATPRFSSTTLTGESAALPVDVDISGATSLRLVVTDAGNDNDFDHADWAQARLIAAPQPPVPQPPPQPSGNAPSAPKKLKAKYHGHRIDLSWKDTARNELGFHVERRTGINGAWVQIADLAANTRGFRDTNLAAGAHYDYRVIAYNAAGVSTPSNIDGEVVPPRGKKVTKLVEDGGHAPKAEHQSLIKIIKKAKDILEKLFKHD
jgi:hypothetical protein